MDENTKLKKIPIIISKCNDNCRKVWRAEIADNYENYHTTSFSKINFEDLSFHFKHNTDTHYLDHLVFYRRKDAVACAKYVNSDILKNKAKIWFL
jgi:hypothetical protein